MNLTEALDEIRRRDEIIASHAAVEREYRDQIAALETQIGWLALILSEACRARRGRA